MGWQDDPEVGAAGAAPWDLDPEVAPQAPPRRSLLSRAAGTAIGVGDAALSGVGAIIGDIAGGGAGLVARATGGDPAAARAAATDAVAYRPRTQAGQEIVGAVGQGLSKAMQSVDESPAGRAYSALVEKTPEPIRKVGGQVLGTAMDIASVAPVVPAAARTMQLAKEAATPVRTTANTLAEKARAGGLRVRPSDIDARHFAGENPSTAGKVGEWVAGGRELETDFVRHNKPIVNGIVADDLGLAHDVPMDAAGLQLAAKPHQEVYQQIRDRVPTVQIDPKVWAQIQSADRGSESVLPLSARAQKVKESLNVEQMSGGELLDTISDLRRKGFKAAASEDPDIADTGLAHLQMADALEAQLDAAVARHAPDLAGKYQEARQGMAKIHSLEVTNVAGEIDPKALARLHKKTERRVMTGGMQYVAEMAEAFPRVVTQALPDPRTLGAGGVLANVATLGLVPATRTAGRAIMARTRGEAGTPQTGLGRALASYYAKDHQVPWAASPREQNLLPSPKDVSMPTGNTGLNPGDGSPAAAAVRNHPGIARETPRPLGLPSPDTVSPPPVRVPEEHSLGAQWASRNHPGSTVRQDLNPKPDLELEPDVPRSYPQQGFEENPLLADLLTQGHKTRVDGRHSVRPPLKLRADAEVGKDGVQREILSQADRNRLEVALGRGDALDLLLNGDVDFSNPEVLRIVAETMRKRK